MPALPWHGHCVYTHGLLSRHHSGGPESRGLAANLVVLAEQEGVSAVWETHGGELPDEENRPAVFAHVRQNGVQVVPVRKGGEKPREKSTSALDV